MHTLFSIVIVFVLGDMALACAALYLLPLLIGLTRRVPDIGSIAAINILLGWTLAGWAVALAMALRSTQPAPPAGQVVQHLPQPWPGPQAPPGWAGSPGPPPPRPGVPPPLTLSPRHAAGPASHLEHQ